MAAAYQEVYVEISWDGSWLFLNIVLNSASEELTAAAALKRQLFKNARAAAHRCTLA